MYDTLKDFLQKINSQKEVSLIIAKDSEFEEIVKTLRSFKFKDVTGIPDLLKKIEKPSKIFLCLKKVFPKEVYDFITQYPTGQIEIYDNHNTEPYVATPIYKGVSIVIVTDPSALDSAKDLGFSVLNTVGLIYRSVEKV